MPNATSSNNNEGKSSPREGNSSEIAEFRELLEVLCDIGTDLDDKSEAVDAITALIVSADNDDDEDVAVSSRHERIMTYIEQYGLVRVLAEEGIGKYHDKFRAEIDDYAYYHGVLHFCHQIFVMLYRLPGDQEKDPSAEIAASITADGGLDSVFDFLNSPWREDTYCVTSCYCAFMGILGAFDKSDEHDCAPVVKKILPVLFEHFKLHALDPSCKESSTNFYIGCQALGLCFDSGNTGITQPYVKPVVQAVWIGMVAYRGDEDAQCAGETTIRKLVGDRPYSQTVVALANCLTWPKGDQYCIMITRAAFENMGITDLYHEFDEGSFQETGRKVLRCLVSTEVYIRLMDHAEMHQNELCNCAGSA